MVPLLYVGVAYTEVLLVSAGVAIASTTAGITYGVTEVIDYFEDSNRQERIIELERENKRLELVSKYGDKLYIKE